MKDRFDEDVVLAAMDTLNYREVLIASQTGGADQDNADDFFEVTDGVGQYNLAAEAGSHRVVRWDLDEVV